MPAQIVQAGQLNISALTVAGVYIVVVPPQLLINGVPSNIIGLVGTASWGPVNQPAIIGGYSQFNQTFGPMVARTFDMGTHVWNIYQQGTLPFLRCCRVTDGTDAAAAVTVQSNCITLTSKYTGTFGNNLQASIGPGAAGITGQLSTRLTVLPHNGALPEVFDNIFQGIQAITTVAGTTFTSVPALSVSAPTGVTVGTISPVTAQVNASLSVYGTPTIGAGGAGYVANDFITLANGVVVQVNAVTSGAITTFKIITSAGCNAGSITGAGTPIPVNPTPQVSTTGVGTGATVNLTWGLGTPTIVNAGNMYLTAPTITLTTSGGGTAGTYTPTIAYWPNVAGAINNGITGLRGPSQYIVATNGIGISSPAVATVNFTGGTDGSAVSTFAMLGVDAVPRTGMFALRALNCSIGVLCDLADSTSFSNQIAFGLSEGVYMIGTGPVGDTISNAATTKANAGIDSYAFKYMFGDWVYMLDTVNGLTRLVSPQSFVAGVLGNLAPNQSTLNKPMFAIVGTQKSFTNITYTNADLSAVATAGMDVIANPIPYGNRFGCVTGHNSSSNASIRGDNYTRMTNFIATTIGAGMGPYIGTLNTYTQRLAAKATLDFFFQNLVYAGLIGDLNNPNYTPPWLVILDDSNNPFSLTSIGVEQAYVKVQFLSVVEELVISIEGGQTVTINRIITPVAQSNVIA